MNPESRVIAESTKALVDFYKDFSLDENIASALNLLQQRKQARINNINDAQQCLLEQQLSVSLAALQRKLRQGVKPHNFPL